jgi:Ca2+-binding RTX toxin-like protein
MANDSSKTRSHELQDFGLQQDGDVGTSGGGTALLAASIAGDEIIEGGSTITGSDDSETLRGTGRDDVIVGLDGNDTIRGAGGDDLLLGGAGDDRMSGGTGFDVMRGGAGNDVLKGDRGNDSLYGESGNDIMHGDSGPQTAKNADFGSDNLNGGAGNDLLVAGDGLEQLTGGADFDTFMFKFNNPMIPLAAGTGFAFSAITDFNAAQDTLAFDAAGLGSNANGANFANNASGGPGSAVDTFFSGAAAGANGESVVVITDQSFASGLLAASTIANEDVGDLVIYFNTTVNVASLLYVSAPNTVNSIARFTNIDDLADLQTANFAAEDFTFV